MVDGGNPQLAAAVAHRLEEIECHGYTPPKRPTFPNRLGMGAREEGK